MEKRELSWYEVDASTLSESARKLVETYAGVPPDEVNAHVDAIRAKAFSIFPYPCIGLYRFLHLGLPESTAFDEVVSRLKEGDKILDLGCCFGQELRNLVSKGVPAENCYGTDLRQEFIDLGYELFRDKETSNLTFKAGNVFDDDFLSELAGQMSIVYTGSFFHLFDYDQQVAVAKRVTALLKPGRGALVIGRQIGNSTPGDFAATIQGTNQKSRFRHDEKTWAEMWAQVGEATGSRWEVESKLEGLGMGSVMTKKLMGDKAEEKAALLRFVVRRIE